jgi:8-oxo-dGTP pyrophosphatase MutT (NUDIX family)
LNRAYRFPADTIEWEVPSGSIEKGEPILEAVRREVQEESGYETTNDELMYTYYPQNGIANQVFHIVRNQAGEKIGDFDRNEVKGFKWTSKQEIQEMIREKVI